jgi:hypothetical protein
MNVKIRLVPTVAAVLLAALGATVVSCGRPDSPPAPLRAGKAVNVIVTYDSMAKTATMSDKVIQLSESSGDWVQWVSPDGLVYVTFDKESPFDAPPTHEKKVLKSHPPKKGTHGKSFDYTAELELFSDKSRVKIDPRIEVLP